MSEKPLMPCAGCGGPKERGVRGGKFCAECRRIKGDAFAIAEAERSRRRRLAELDTKLASGQRVFHRRLDTPDGMKWCTRCQDFRPITSFAERAGQKRASNCKPCQRLYNAEHRLMVTFGLTWEEYDFLLATQNYRCAICEGRPRKHLLAVDHDHRTGEIRGLLCARCNRRLLGAANDDPARLRKAADYLEAFAAREVFGVPKFVPGAEPTEAVS